MQWDKSMSERILMIITLGIVMGVFLWKFFPLWISASNDRLACDVPLHYSLGDIDERFPLSEREFLVATLWAERIWEDALGKNVLEYRGDAEFFVDTFYDERQERAEEEVKLKESIRTYESTYEKTEAQYETAFSVYLREKKLYEKNARDLEEDFREYNEEVEEWNEKGGAPEGEYKKLTKKLKKLEEKQSVLELQRERVNMLAERSNAFVTNLQESTENINVDILTFSEIFGEPTPFVQGEYFGDKITIYQFLARDELRLVLAHEFGHALGIDHVENPQSIMYYLMGEQGLEDPRLSSEDVSAFLEACPEKEETPFDHLRNWLLGVKK